MLLDEFGRRFYMLLDCNSIFILTTILFASAFFIAAYFLIKEKKAVRMEKEKMEDFEALTNSDYQINLAKKVSKLALWKYNIETDAFMYSHDFFELLGINKEHVGMDLKSWKNCIHEDDYKSFVDFINQAKNSDNATTTFEYFMRLKDNTDFSRTFLLKASANFKPADTKPISLTGAFLDLKKIIDTQRELKTFLEFDILTNAKTRFYFQSKIEEANAVGLHPVSFIYCDINGLHLINEHISTEAGDKQLKELVRVLRSVIRVTDMVARLGNDEFVVFLASCNNTALKRICNNLDRTIEEYNNDESHVPLYISYTSITSNLRFDTWNGIRRQLNSAMVEAEKLNHADNIEQLKTWLKKNNYFKPN